MGDQEALIYRFGTFELDTRAGVLRRNGRTVALQARPLDVLLALLERPGEIVDRETLRRRLWPEDFHVDTETGINAAVARLRDALGDRAANPCFVATVPRRGYRFIAPVDHVSVDGGSVDTESVDPRATSLREAERVARAPRPRWRMAIVLAMTIAVTVGAVAFLRWPSTPRDIATLDGEIRLAVLPFEDLSAADDGDLVGAGLTAELISVLGRLAPERLRVIALSSVLGFRGDAIDLDSVGQRLDVDYVLEGTVRREASVARVTVALVDVAEQAPRWSASYDRDSTSLLALEREIAAEVVGALALALDVSATAPKPRDGAAGAAGAHILRGRAQLAQRTEAGFQQALRSFQAAIVEDPSAASAYAGLAATWTLLGIWDHAPRERAYPEAERWATRALRLDPHAAEAHLVQGAVAYWYGWQFDAAAQHFSRALALNPSDAQAQLFAARFWTSQGANEAALEALARALTLDPLSPSSRSQACWLYFVLDHPDEALASCHRALALDHDFLGAWDNLKWIHIRQGNEAEAIDAFLRVVALEEIHADGVAGQRVLAEREGLAGLLRASLEGPSDRLAESGQSPYNLALDHAALGETDVALDWLDQAYAARETDLVNLAVDPRLDGLRANPRFDSLVARVGLRTGIPTGPISPPDDPLRAQGVLRPEGVRPMEP